MTKKDLKTGMVVKLRNGGVYRVFRDVEYYIMLKVDVLIPYNNDSKSIDFSKYYDDSLKYMHDCDYDIVEVRQIGCVTQLVNDFNFDTLTLIWKREEKKKYTYAQLRELVGEDFEIVEG